MLTLRSVAVLSVVSLLLIETFEAQNCHYSCQTCILPHHQFCKNCIQGYQFKVVRNPIELPAQYKKMRSVTGICTTTQDLAMPNVLGIILLILAFLFIPITKNALLFHIVTTLQFISLFKLLQLGWLVPVSYILNSFQYFSPCNIITNQIKQNSWELKLYSYSQIQKLYIQPHLDKSLAFLGILNVIVFSLIFIVHLTWHLKVRYFEQKCRGIFILTEHAFKTFINYLNCLFYFLIQQTVLSIVISLQFLQQDTFAIAAITISVIMLIMFCLEIVRYKIVFFSNRLIQYYSIVKKIVYPIFVIIPFKYQYFLVILMLINCILEAIFDYKLKTYPPKSRNTLYKIVQFLTYLFIGAFYVADKLSTSSEPALATNYILAIFLVINIVFFVVEIAFGVKERIVGKNSNELKVNEQNVMIPQASVLNRNENTGLANTKRQATQESFVDNDNVKSKIKMNFSNVGSQGDKQKQKQKSDTKDSQANKKSKSDIRSNDIEIVQIQQVSVRKQKKKKKDDEQGQAEEPNEDGQNEEQRRRRAQLNKRRAKRNMELKNQLKKRYGF